MKVYMEEKLKEIEVYRACCGEDEDGFSRAAAAVKLLMLKGEEKAEEIDEIVLDNPVINIYRDPRRTLIDLTFLNVMDFELTNLVVRLQSFFSEKLSMRQDAIPSVMVTLAPKEFAGQYYVSAIHGMWFVMPSVIGGENDTVRFIFENDLVNCFEAEDTGEEQESEEEGINEDDYYV